MSGTAPYQGQGQVPMVPGSPIPTSFATSFVQTTLVPTYPTSTRSRPEPTAVEIDLPDTRSSPDQQRPILSRFFSLFSEYLSLGNSRACSHGQDSSTEKTGLQGLKEALGYAFDSASYWTGADSDSDSWSPQEQHDRSIPQYVLDYAPYVHLYSKEEFWPCDIAEHLIHTTPKLNYTPIYKMRRDRTLDNLQELNRYGSRFVFLTSDDNVEERPDWLGGSQNIPEDVRTVFTNGTERPVGHSSAPAVLIVVRKPGGIVDAFWFYFYSYNLGNTVFNVRFGNHVGDWEHTLVRFIDGKPEQIALSEHSWGEAYSYEAMEKIDKRPLTFSAVGSHAMYATPGPHPYVLPLGLLHDQTDRGPLWDPSLNLHSYTYDLRNGLLRASNHTPQAPTSWFYFGGHWGDKAYPMSDKRQYQFAGQYHYVSGPLGARFKNLGRSAVCQSRGKCEIRHWLPPPGEVRHISHDDLVLGDVPDDPEGLN